MFRCSGGVSCAIVLDNLDSLVTRLARKEGGNSDTLGTYKQRAESILRDFLDYHRDPLKFQSKTVERPAKTATKPSEKKKKPDAGESAAPSASTPSAESEPAAGRRFAFPLGGGREFVYVLPPDGIKVAEVMKISFHLGSMATDFDPSAKDVEALTLRVRGPRDAL